MAYDIPSCTYCPDGIRACRKGEDDTRGPGWCPGKLDPDGIEAGFKHYDDPEIAKAHRESSRVEAEGYCVWTRVEEVVAFAKKMEYRRIGIAFCVGCFDLAATFGQILESHGFQVASVCCKTGGIPKEDIGLADEEKIRPGQFEAICNPATQAEMLNRAETDFNVVIGLCVGHDSLFFRHSKALVTTLVAKDRALGHNPAAALLLADGYMKRVWGPLRPETPPKRPRTSDDA